jgi:hypothetical protein
MALVGSISGSYGITAVTSSFEPGVDNLYYSGNSSKKWSNVVSTAFTGSLTKLADGSDYLLAGSNITLTTGSGGAVTIAASSAASTAAQYLTLATDASLANERVFTPSTGLSASDGGSNGNYTLSIDNSVVATISGSTFTGAVKFNQGLSGSLTQLVDGTSYLVAGTNVTITSASNGSVTISSAASTTPGGSNYDVQYNSGGAFGGANDLTWTYDTTKILGVNGQISASLGITGSEIFVANLTPGRVVYGGTSGRLAGDSGMTYNDGTDVLSVGSSTFGTDVVVAGDLTVNGTTTTINTQNLLVKDPVILMGTGSIGPNANGGIAIFSGSTGASGDDLVFGRVANDTWGVGTLDTENGTVTSVAGMTLTNMRAATYEVGSTSATITTAGAGNMVVSGSTVAVSGSTVTFVKDGTQVAYVGTSGGLTGFFPSADVTYNLGSTALRWQNIYTGDLHLRNERGDYTLIEEEDFLSIRFNKTGKRYKFVLEPVPELDEK